MYGFPGLSALTPNLLPAGLTGATSFPPLASLMSSKYNTIAAIAITSFWANRRPVHYCKPKPNIQSYQTIPSTEWKHVMSHWHTLFEELGCRLHLRLFLSNVVRIICDNSRFEVGAEETFRVVFFWV